MKSKKFIFRCLLFTFLACCCSVFVKLSFDRKTPGLGRENVEALAGWEEDYQIAIKWCKSGDGWCIINSSDFMGLVYAEK